jgi:SNF2 family DNA or RNA helicase
MTKEEWLKLPKKNVHDIYVNLGDDQREFYKSLQSNYIAKIDDTYIEVDNALVMMSKLYQVSNGFVYINEKTEDDEIEDLIGESGKKKKKKTTRHTRFFESQPKINALIKLLSGSAKGKRAILWFNMEAEYQLISRALEEARYSFLSIKGGDRTIGEKVRKFNNDPSIDYLVCQAKSVNYGITVLGTTLEKLEDSDYEIFPDVSPEVHTEIFYSCNFSLEVYLQQQDRIHRIGQTKECDYYRIFANTNVDQKIRRALDDKLFIRKSMLIDIAKELKETPELLV